MPSDASLVGLDLPERKTALVGWLVQGIIVMGLLVVLLDAQHVAVPRSQASRFVQ